MNEKFDAILIPGGGIVDEAHLPAWVEKRLDKAIEIHNGNEFIITLSKGTTHKPPVVDATGMPVTESKAGAIYLNRKGISANLLLVEELSLDTIGNAYFARVLFTEPLNLNKLLIVTSEFHMTRTKAIFEWIFNIDTTKYSLTFITTEDAGIEENDLIARKERENNSLQNVLKLREKVVTYAQLHKWIYTEHNAYKFLGEKENLFAGTLKSY